MTGDAALGKIGGEALCFFDIAPVLYIPTNFYQTKVGMCASGPATDVTRKIECTTRKLTNFRIRLNPVFKIASSKKFDRRLFRWLCSQNDWFNSVGANFETTWRMDISSDDGYSPPYLAFVSPSDGNRIPDFDFSHIAIDPDANSDIFNIPDCRQSRVWDNLSDGKAIAVIKTGCKSYLLVGGNSQEELQKGVDEFGRLLKLYVSLRTHQPLSKAEEVTKFHETLLTRYDELSNSPLDTATQKNSAANELFSLPEIPEGVVADLSRMFASADEDEVWRDYCLQFLGSALERTDGVTDEDRALARETLVEALDSTNATFAGTALRALHRGDPSDPLVASNAIRIARDPSYPSASRTTALLILEECTSISPGTDGAAVPPDRLSVLRETSSAVSADPSASSLLQQTAGAVLKRNTD